MASDIDVQAIGPVTTVTLDASSTTYLAGTLLAYDGTNWVKANAATFATLYARFICLESVSKGGSATYVMPVATEALVWDSDAPYTADAKQYLSGSTAGTFTETRPTTDAHLRQVVGQARSTSYVHLALRPLREVEKDLILAETTSGEAAFGSITALDSGTYEGIQLNANGEYATWIVKLPDSFVSIALAELFSASESDSSSTYAVTVNSVVPGAAGWDTVTADTSVTALASVATAAGDPIGVMSLVSALDAASIARPGALLSIKIVHSNDSNAQLFFGGRIICNVV